MRIVVIVLLLKIAVSADWKLVWSDEFNYYGLPDSTKWGYDIGGHGWGNQELQYYTKNRVENAFVNNGVLTITVNKESYENRDHTSARLITKNKGDWLYGRFEVAAKLPQGRGVWPAIWMLPSDNEYGVWPASGELDIMENVGYDPNVVHFNIHTQAYHHSIGTNKGNRATLVDPHYTFNIYAMEWFEDHVAFFANGDTIFTFFNEHKTWKEWPFDKRFHLLLNIAVGGSWGGQKGIDDNIFPQKFTIDYVRVYKKDNTTARKPKRSNTPIFPVITQSGNFLRINSPELSGRIQFFSINGKFVNTVLVSKEKSSYRKKIMYRSGIYITRCQFIGFPPFQTIVRFYSH